MPVLPDDEYSVACFFPVQEKTEGTRTVLGGDVKIGNQFFKL
jgi:hypothetical protein